MIEIDLFNQPSWNLLYFLGIDHPAFYVNTTTLLNTYIVLILLLFLCLIIRYYATKTTSITHYIISKGVRLFMQFSKDTLGGTFMYYHCAIAFAFFIFILLCNSIAIFPWAVEPTKDLNTTLAFGLIIFFYKDWQIIKLHGLRTFLKEFIDPIFIMLPINLVGHLSKVISISFRLFGNIFGGSVILELYRALMTSGFVWSFLGLASGVSFLVTFFFGFFEGLIQAIVFAMLSLTYIALAIQKDSHD